MTPEEARHHDQLRELLPWYVNGTLEGRERDAVEAHLAECDRCRIEAEELDALQEILVEGPHLPADTPAEGADEAPPWAAAAPPPSSGNRLRTLVMMQSLLLLVLAGLVLQGRMQSRADADFRTLSSDPATVVSEEGHFTVVFEDDVTELQLRRFLQGAGAEIVSGPTSVGAYRIEVRAGEAADGDPDGLLESLRSDSITRLVERASP